MMTTTEKVLVAVVLVFLSALPAAGQTGGGTAPPSGGIPEITRLEFPNFIPSDGSKVVGTIGFRDPDSDIVSVEITVVKAIAFSSFSFNPGVAGKVEGIFQFLIFSELGQQVTLEATLTDERGNRSSAARFSFVAGKRLTPQIAFLAQWGSFGLEDREFDLPRAVTVDREGNVYVVDSGNHRVQKFSRDGQLLAKWGGFCDLLVQRQSCVDPDGDGPLEAGDGQFALPQGIALDNAGNVYVTDFGNARVQKFDSNGTFLLKWGTRGRGEGQFNQPLGIAVDKEGYVYVSDYGNDRVQKFDGSGKFLLRWGSLGGGEGQFHFPRGMALDSRGNVYVVDSGNHRVQKFSSMGTFLGKWGIPGTQEGQFFLPFGIAVDLSDNVYVADALNHRIQKFDTAGNYRLQWGSLGQAEGLFNNPTGIAIDGDGNIYVADSLNNRLQKFVDLLR